MADKYVYDFSEGNKDHEAAARRQGRQPRRDDQHRPAGAARLHHHHRGLQPLLRQRARIPRVSTEQVETALQHLEKDTGKTLRRPRRPAAGLGALRRPRQHAGHDGHHPQPGPERHHGPGRHQEHRQRALRLRLLPPLRDHVRRRRAGLQAGEQGRGRPLRGAPRPDEEAPRRARSTPSSPPTTSRSSSPSSRQAVHESVGKTFPEDPREQLWGAIGAVFGSWINDRAIAYRSLYDIPDTWGTAVNVQTMVYGNIGDDSGTGVAFTRNPATGENVFYGEFLVNAQGEDVVAGVRTPRPVDRARGGLARRLRPAPRGAPDARARDARHAGLRVHHRAGPPLHAADAQRQAHRPGRHPHRRRHGRRGPDRPGRGAHAGRARPAQPAPAADLPRPGRAGRREGRQGLSPRACRPAPAPPPAGSSSTPPTRWPGPSAASRSSSCATSRAPKTSAAWTPPRASSPPRAA